MVAAVAAAVAAAFAAPAAPTTALAAGPSAYSGLTPTRLLDTRLSALSLPAGGSLDLTVAGVAGVPGSASGVVLNVTATNPGAPGFLTVFPAGTARPFTSNLNFQTGQTVPNLVEVPVGDAGQVSIFASSATDVVVDVEGFFGIPAGSAGGYVALTPARIVDTRISGGHLGSGATGTVQVTGAGGVPGSGVSGVALNVTVTNTTAPGHLTVFPSGQAQPLASNLNWLPGQTVPNRVFVPVGTDGRVNFFNFAGSSDLVVDVSGFFTDGTATGRLFTPLNPIRIADTRLSGQTLGPLGSVTVQVGGLGGVPVGASAAILNVTATNTTAAGFLSVFPGGAARPNVSDLNWVAGQTVPNLVAARLSPGGAITIFNSAGSTDVVVDVFGFFAIGVNIGITITANPTTIPANGTSTAVVTVTLVDANGAAVPDDPVAFSTSGNCGTLSPATAITDVFGAASVTYTSSTTVGACPIIVTEANGANSNTIFIIQVASPNTVALLADPGDVVPADGAAHVVLRATVTDPNGVAVVGDRVNFTASGTCGVVSPSSNTTNSSGRAAVVYISATTVGFCTITATTATATAGGVVTITQTQSPAPVNGPFHIASAASPASLPADGAAVAVVTATVMDTANAPVSGVPVRFTRSASVEGSCGGLSASTATTGSNGVATVVYTASSVPGSCTIIAKEASTAQIVDTLVITQTPPANTVTVSASPSVIPAGSGQATVAATVTAPFSGAAVRDVRVDFAAFGTCGQLTPTFGFTNAVGRAAVTYFASAGSGFCTVTATDASGGIGSVLVIQTIGPVNRVTVAANRTTLPADGSSRAALTISVRNASGAAVGADPVTFFRSGICGSLNQTTTSTSDSGMVAVIYTVPATIGAVGTCTITVIEANGAGTSTIAITQVAPTNRVVLTLSTSSVPANGRGPAIVTATVTDPNGNPVSGDPIIFGGSGTCGSLSQSVRNTGPDGNAAVVYISSTVVGFCTISATEAGGNPGSTAAVLIQTKDPKPSQVTGIVTTNPATGVGQSSIPADARSHLIVTVTVSCVSTCADSPAVGDQVRLRVSGFGCGTVTPVFGATDPQGILTATYTAGAAVGSCQLTASEANGGSSTTVTITQTAP